MKNIFQLSRFANIARHDLIMNKKSYIYIAFAIAAISFIIPSLIFMFGADRALPAVIFKIIYQFALVVIIGIAFPAFRNKEKTISYLMLPASTFEKFTYQFLLRTVIATASIIVLFCGMYYIAESLAIFLNPDTSIVTFSFSDIISIDGYIDSIRNTMSDIGAQSSDEFNKGFNSGVNATMMESTLFTNVFIQPLYYMIFFIGASFFGKLPLIKTWLISTGIYSICMVFVVIKMISVFKGIETTGPESFSPETIFQNLKNNIWLLTYGFVIINIGFIIGSYFIVKNKSV